MPRAEPAIRRFDLRDELRATAERRKQAAEGSAAAQLRGEGVGQMAERLAAMFPSLPADTVQAVLSELFRADASCSRAELADRAVAALLEMTFAAGPQELALTCFEPRAVGAPAAELPAPSAPPLAELAAPAEPASASGQPSGSEEDVLDELLDVHLAALLSLPDDALPTCAQTLASVLDRIAEEPENARVRRLRCSNARFAAAVGRHEAAVDLLRLAGFEDDAGEGHDDPGLAFRGSPASSASFGRVREALHGVVEELAAAAPMPAGPRPAAPAAAPAAGAPAGPSDNRRLHMEARSRRRGRVAELTEQRLADPRGFRQRAEAQGAANRAAGGALARPSRAPPAAPSRRAQHFTLADVERRRIADEIAGTPNYAAEYQREVQGGPAHDYGTLVARSYDPQLIARQALDGTNRYRASKGLPPCRWHGGIARVAAEHAAQMASGAAPFNHDGFNARVAAFPVAQRAAAENLALNSGVANVAEAAVEGWIKSPGHEKNLRGPYNLCGIGVARSSNGTFYLTQLFAQA